jgi:hypothetical protein
MSNFRILIIAVSLLLPAYAQAQLGSALGDAAKQLEGSAAGTVGAAAESASGAAAAPAVASSGGLTGVLVQQLGVTQPQATGGAGAIFGLAKTKMSAEDFGKVAAGVPDMNSLLAAAPTAGGATGGLTGGLAGAAGGLGGATGSLGSLAGLAGSFSSLGMSADMATKFVPICVQYLQGTAGPETAGLLQAALQ